MNCKRNDFLNIPIIFNCCQIFSLTVRIRGSNDVNYTFKNNVGTLVALNHFLNILTHFRFVATTKWNIFIYFVWLFCTFLFFLFANYPFIFLTLLQFSKRFSFSFFFGAQVLLSFQEPWTLWQQYKWLFWQLFKKALLWAKRKEKNK